MEMALGFILGVAFGVIITIMYVGEHRNNDLIELAELLEEFDDELKQLESDLEILEKNISKLEKYK